jgi:hypothetical protein
MTATSRIDRLAPSLAAAGGLAYALEGAIAARASQPEHHWHASGYAIEAAFIVALVTTIPVVPLLRAGSSRAERLAARLSQLGFAAMLASAIASVAAGGDALGPAFFGGVLAALAGLLVLAAPAIRARRPGWWAAPLALVGVVLGMALGDHGGGILLGLAWIGISIALRERLEQTLPAAANT